MPVRLIIVLLLVVCEAFFIGFNLENTCNVWLFKQFEAVPVYITVLLSFAAGVLVSILFFAFGKMGRFIRRSREGRLRKGRPGGLKGRKHSASGGDSSNKPEAANANNPKI